jgi:hypothetical protein
MDGFRRDAGATGATVPVEPEGVDNMAASQECSRLPITLTIQGWPVCPEQSLVAPAEPSCQWIV